MIPRALHHVSFSIADLERSLRFYEGVLGLEQIERPNFPFAGAWLRVGDAELHLIVPPAGVDVGGQPPSLNPLARHAAFAIDDYASVLAALKSAGLAVLETNPELGQMWVRDPDGNIIELIARPAAG
jgi:glyoxylase I family protein